MEPDLWQLAGALLKVALMGLTGVLFLAVVIGFLLKGPSRPVKILTALLVLSLVATVGALTGWGQALTVTGVMAALVVGSMAVALLFWSQPARRTFRPGAPADCPAHARDRLDRWTAELAALGFVFHSDQLWQWRFGGVARDVFVRLFSHGDQSVRAEIHAMANPKVAARACVSLMGDGRTVMTSDQQSDAEHFSSEAVATVRVASGSTTERLLGEHRAATRRYGTAVPTEDPVAAHLASYHRWVDELVTRGVVVVRGDAIRVRLRSMPGIVLRVLAAWFH